MELVKDLWSLKFPYVNEEAAKNLPKYKYVGSDSSPLHIYLWSPMASFIADRLPRWIAYFI